MIKINQDILHFIRIESVSLPRSNVPQKLPDLTRPILVLVQVQVLPRPGIKEERPGRDILPYVILLGDSFMRGFRSPTNEDVTYQASQGSG